MKRIPSLYVLFILAALTIALAACGRPVATPTSTPIPTLSPTLIPTGAAVIHVTTTSDWTNFRLMSGGMWSNSTLVSSSSEATNATIEGNLISLSQPLARAEAGNSVELTLEVLFGGLDPSSQVAFEIQRGYIGWTQVEISTYVDGQPAPLKTFVWDKINPDNGNILEVQISASELLAPRTVADSQAPTKSVIPAAPTSTSLPKSNAFGTADIIFTNGKVVTMDDANPNAEAIAIQGDKILAVGTNDAVLMYQAKDTILVDLQGRTLVPGFIDSHQHRIGDRAMGGYKDADAAIQAAIEQGWTSINELFVDPARLNELRALDEAERLRLRVNAYLALANPQGQSYGDWYQAYTPRTEYSPYLRLIGVKLYMDHGWGLGKVMWSQEQVDQMVMEAHQHGWQVAAHTVGEQAHTMILNALEKSLGGVAADPYRDRIEHVVVISDEDMQRMQRLGIIASIQLNGPGTWVDSPDFATGVTPDMYPHFARWRDLSEAGVFMIGSSDWPYGTLEPGFGSPMLLLYQGVTRTGTNRRPPEQWMIGQNLTMEQSLRLLTINGAYGTFEEDKKGSLKAGKLADMVILSDNPLTAPIEKVPDIQVLMTMIGGKVEYCAPGHENICP